MRRYEYWVVPAPRRGEKARGAKTMPERFGVTLTALMNRMGADGWEYLRADTLPCEERVGLTGRTTTFQNMLVFRRDVPDGDAAFSPEPAVRSPEVVGPIPRPGPRLGAAETPAGPAPALGPAAPGAPASGFGPGRSTA